MGVPPPVHTREGRRRDVPSTQETVTMAFKTKGQRNAAYLCKHEASISEEIARQRTMKDCPQCGGYNARKCGTCHGKGRVAR
jgi:hypothetical protein